MSKKLALVLMALVTVLGASSAHAQFYVGASFTSSDAELEDAAGDFDADDESFKIFAGYDFAKFVGLEATYRDFGTFEDTLGDVDLEAFDLALRGIIPLGEVVRLFGKAGYSNIQVDFDFDDDLIEDFDDDDWEFMYGVGIDLLLWEHFGIRGEWEQFDVDDDLNTFSAGAFFRF